jgi:hypothetical protein
MKEFPWEVVVLAVVLAVNRLIVPATYTRAAAFWALQVMNLSLAVVVVMVGLPGLANYPVVNWMIAGLLAFHAFQNIALRRVTLDRAEADAAERERIKQVRRLHQAAAEPPRDEAPPE